MFSWSAKHRDTHTHPLFFCSLSLSLHVCVCIHVYTCTEEGREREREKIIAAHLHMDERSTCQPSARLEPQDRHKLSYANSERWFLDQKAQPLCFQAMQGCCPCGSGHGTRIPPESACSCFCREERHIHEYCNNRYAAKTKVACDRWAARLLI